MKTRLFAVTSAALLILGVLPATVAARQPIDTERPLPATIGDLRLDQPETRSDLKGKIHTSLADVRGPQRVMVRLTSAPSVAVEAQGGAAQTAQLGRVRAQQQVVIAAARRLDSKARVLGRTARATNIVALRIDGSKLDALARDPNVVSIKPVIDYQMALSETVPYIGATAVQDRGYTGEGVRVAVLDSGIDYTHAALGGAGTLAAYEAAYGATPADPRNTTLDGLFPTDRVKGGYDFVGESWPDGDGIEDPDPDPIDFDGHGTHVADIIGGQNGVAPDVSLYALKVCSSVTPACSGVALIQAMDWAIDPNGDGKTRDHVDVINMSLGSDYGSVYDDDLSLAVDRASKIGVLTVAAAGNGGDKPWIAGTPASAKTALSVAQTQVPSARAFPLVVNAPAAIAGTYTNTETVDWAPLGSGFSGNVVFLGRGCPAGSIDGTNPADPYLANPAGKVALIDRGGCSVSLKVDRAAKAGATAVLIGLVAPGDAVSFSFGGGDTFVPTMVIQQSLSTAIKTQLTGGATVTVSVSDAVSIPLIGSMVGSSSRGPSTPDNTVKPEIGAPGASVSAVAGSGTGTQAFGGTSGATPMVAGAAALIIDAFPQRSVAQIKSVLMNTAETDIFNNAANTPGYLAPITRIGGGEIRVDRALKSPAAAWDRKTGSGTLSFGLLDVTDKTVVLRRTVEVRNYSNKTRTYKVSSTFRFEDDKLNRAIRISLPSSVRVPRRGKATFTVKMTIDGRKLREWTLDSGANALNARLLDTLEYDGYVWLNDKSTSSDNADPMHLAWHVLPRLSGEIHAPRSAEVHGTIADGVFAGLPAAHIRLRNEGVGPGYVDAYSLVGTSPNLPRSKRGTNAPVIDLRAVGVQTFPVPADFCSADPSFIYVFAINTWERTGTIGAFPGEFDIFLDTDLDGKPDYLVFNAPLNGTLDARELVWAVNLDDPDAVADAFFFADSGTNDANKVMTICGEQIGMNATNFFDVMNMDVGAFDNYFTGAKTDSIVGMKVAPLGERYLGMFGTDGSVSGDIPPFSRAVMDVVDFGPSGTNPSETGLMLVANASRGDVRGGAPPRREALLIRIED